MLNDSTHGALANAEMLPSWADGTAREAIVDFLLRVTAAGTPDFVAPERRIAVFDDDGTLWCEQPVKFQLAFTFDRIRRMAQGDPQWTRRESLASLLASGVRSVAAAGEQGAVRLMAESHCGMSADAFAGAVRTWMRGGSHPRFNCRYSELVYRPMQELMQLLRTHGFKTFIVSSGAVEFIRAFAHPLYGVPPEQVIGSCADVKFDLDARGEARLTQEPEVDFVDPGPGKVRAIHRFIGRRPIVAFGNADSDLQMLQYSCGGFGPRLAGVIHHTDGEREYAYDRNSHVGRLEMALLEAKHRGWLVVDMKEDWKTVFPFERKFQGFDPRFSLPPPFAPVHARHRAWGRATWRRKH